MRLLFCLAVALFIDLSRCTAQVCPHNHGFKSHDVIPVKVFAFDFDQTATPFTAKDSSEVLYKATTAYRNDNRQVRETIDTEWKHAVFSKDAEYIHDLTKETLSRLRHSSLSEAQKMAELRTYVTKMDQFYGNLLKYVVAHKMFEGITTEGLREIARQMSLCPGLITTLKRFQNPVINVISAGMSKRFVEDVFNQHNAPTNLKIHCGELIFKNGQSTTDITGRLTTSGKERVLGDLISQAAIKKGYSIYIGNAYVDLLAMLRADIGIVINYTVTFLRVVHAFGIKTLPVGDWRRLGGCSREDGDVETRPVIYTAQSWDEIGELVFGSGPVTL